MLDETNSSLVIALHRSQLALHKLPEERNQLEAVLAAALLEFLPAANCEDARLYLALPSDDPTTVIIAGGRHIQPPAEPKSESRYGIEESVRRSGARAFVEDTRYDEAWIPGPFPVTTAEPWSALCEPLKMSDRTIGTITFLRRGIGKYTEKRLSPETIFADQVQQSLAARYFHAQWRSAQNRISELSADHQDLAAILVHDLQGPLANVIISLELAQSNVASKADDSLSTLIDLASRSAEQLKALVDSVIDISRLQAGYPLTGIEPVSLHEVIECVAEIQAPAIEQRQVQLVPDIASDLRPVAANQDILQRILLNLLDNALRVSRRGQAITIRARADDTDQFARIDVIDQGPGIPEEHRDRIFEKFERIEGASSSKGLGLGLAFCKLAVEAHGGQIWLEDAPGNGACFCIRLPLSPTVDSPNAS